MRTFLRSKVALLFVMSAVLLAGTAIAAIADEVANNLDNSVDTTVENMNLTAGGANGSAKLYVVGTTQSDTINGCNFKDGGDLLLNVSSSSPGVATVSPSQVTISDCGENNGAAISVTPVSQGTSTITVTKRNQSTVGGNFTLTTATFQVNVTGVVKQNQTISFGALPNKTFGDANFGLNATASSGLPVSYAASGNCAIAGANNDQVSLTGAGSCEITASQGGNATYNAATPVKQSFNIAKATPTIAWSNPQDITYGTALSSTQLNATAKGVDGNTLAGSFAYTPNAGTVLNAGTQNLSTIFTPTNTANYNNANAQVQLVVGKADTTTKITCTSGPFTYDGTAKTPCSAKVTGPNGLDQPVAVDYSNNTNAGTATASASYAGTANYKPSSDSTTFTIDKANATIDVNGYTGTYDGNAHGASGTATGVGNVDLSSGLDLGQKFTDVPGGTAHWTFNGGTNYNDAAGDVQIDISKAKATIKVDGYAGVYDGNAHGATSTATGVGGVDLSNQLDLGASFTNVPGGTANWSFAGNGNYEAANGSVNIAISKATSTTTVTCTSGPFTYNGSAQTPCSVSVTGAGGLNLSPNPDYANNVNAGTATASYTYTGDANHTGSQDSKTFTIDKATAQVALSNLNHIYDGTAKAAQVSTTPAGLNVTVTYNGSATAPTAVNSYNVVATVNEANYKGQATGTLTIGAWTFSGFYQPVDMNNTLNTIKGGSTVPIKFELFKGATELTDTGSVQALRYKEVPCTALSAATLDDIELTATGGTVLRYDTTGGQYVYNWQTPKTVGKCYSVTISSNDGSSQTAYFKTK